MSGTPGERDIVVKARALVDDEGILGPAMTHRLCDYIEDLRGVIRQYESDPDYARSRFREIDLLHSQRAHDRLKIKGLQDEIKRLSRVGNVTR